ncbi:5111_t:CDS:1, partial [Ambispora gerdemannii]
TMITAISIPMTKMIKAGKTVQNYEEKGTPLQHQHQWKDMSSRLTTPTIKQINIENKQEE